MAEKVKALENVIKSLDDLDASLMKEIIDNPHILALKVNNLVGTLHDLSKEGRVVDEMCNTVVPVSLIEHLDQPERSNPDLYKLRLVREGLKNAEKFQEKARHLEAIKNDLTEEARKLFGDF